MRNRRYCVRMWDHSPLCQCKAMSYYKMTTSRNEQIGMKELYLDVIFQKQNWKISLTLTSLCMEWCLQQYGEEQCVFLSEWITVCCCQHLLDLVRLNKLKDQNDSTSHSSHCSVSLVKITAHLEKLWQLDTVEDSGQYPNIYLAGYTWEPSVNVHCCLFTCSWIFIPVSTIKCVCGFSPAEFPTPKTELVQKFQVLYLGMLPVARPIGQFHTQTHTQYSCKLQMRCKVCGWCWCL